MEPEGIYLILRRSHILVGISGVLAFWVAAVAKKGGRAHIAAGRAFEWCGYYVTATALFACLRYLTTRHHYAFVERPNASPDELMNVEGAQFLLTLLAFLAWTFLVQLRIGVRVVRTRHKSAEEYRNWEAKWWLYSQPAACVALVAYAAFRLANGGHSMHWISIVVGMIPLFEFNKERHFYLHPREQKMSWWLKHMDCMMGCGVAFHTAGMVFLSRWLGRYFQFELSGLWQLVPWILPVVVGVPLANRWLASYRKKFGDGGDQTEPAAHVSQA